MYFCRNDCIFRLFKFTLLIRLLHSLLLLSALFLLVFDLFSYDLKNKQKNYFGIYGIGTNENVFIILISLFFWGMLLCIILSWSTYVLSFRLPLLNFYELTILVRKKPDSNNVKLVMNANYLDFNTYMFHLLYTSVCKIFYLSIGITHSLGVLFVLNNIWNHQSITTLCFLTLLLESLQIPLSLILSLLPSLQCFRCIMYGFFSSMSLLVISITFFPISFIHNKSLMYGEHVENINHLTLRRVSLLYGLTTLNTKLYCRQDQQLCQYQKKILGIITENEYFSDKINTFTDNIKKLRRSGQHISFIDKLKILQSTYRLELYFNYLRNDSKSIIKQMNNNRNSTNNEASKTNEKLTEDTSTNDEIKQLPQNIEKCKQVFMIENEDEVELKSITKLLEPNTDLDIFFYPDTNETVAFTKKTKNKKKYCVDRLNIDREFFVECQINSEDVNDLYVMCDSNRGREIDFLMASIGHSTPLWVFNNIKKIHSGILTLNELERIFTKAELESFNQMFQLKG